MTEPNSTGRKDDFSLIRANKPKLERRLEATQSQIKILESALSQAKKDELCMDPKVYQGLIAGYNSIIEDLNLEVYNYQMLLKHVQ